MIKTHRLYNLLMTGGIGGAALDALLEDRSYAGALYELRSDSVQMKRIYQSPLAMAALGGSVRALEIMGRDVGATDGNVASLFDSGEAMAQMVAQDSARTWLMGHNALLQDVFYTLYATCTKYWTMAYSATLAPSSEISAEIIESIARDEPGLVFGWGVTTKAQTSATTLTFSHPNGEIAGNIASFAITGKTTTKPTNATGYSVCVSLNGASVAPLTVNSVTAHIIELWQPVS